MEKSYGELIRCIMKLFRGIWGICSHLQLLIGTSRHSQVFIGILCVKCHLLMSEGSIDTKSYFLWYVKSHKCLEMHANAQRYL